MLVERIRNRLSVPRLKRVVRRWATRDRAWVGRLASGLGTIRIEGCLFRIDSPLISNSLKSRMLYGRYERTERELLRRHLVPSMPVIELGGGIGAVACIVNNRLENRRSHIVVEANRLMLPLISTNRDANGAQFELVHGAIAYTGTHVSLKTGEDLLASQTQSTEGGDVPVVHLEELVEKQQFARCTLICDIEGAEIELVDREIATLQSCVAMIVIEEHPEYCSDDARAAMFAKLEQGGFQRVEKLRKVHVLRNSRLLE
jgi:FkbM family methyltransferase